MDKITDLDIQSPLLVRGHIRPREELTGRITASIINNAGNVFIESEGGTDTQIEQEVQRQIYRGNYRAEDAWSRQRIRVGQTLFRRDVLLNFGDKCCICGLDVPELLDAAHIREWGDDKDNRLNPRNGLCRCKLHHKAFDLGLISVGTDRQISVIGSLRRSSSEAVRTAILKYDGREILPPARWMDLLL